MAYDPTSDPRYGQDGWTLIRPGNGPAYFVRSRKTKPRAKPRALRFADVAEGDVLIHRAKFKIREQTAGRHLAANDDWRDVTREVLGFAIVEHVWFDPVAGEDDPVAGQFVAVRGITAHGLAPSLSKHTRRGLASQGFYPLPELEGRAVADWVAARESLIARHDAGELSAAEVRAAHTPWRVLMRKLGEKADE